MSLVSEPAKTIDLANHLDRSKLIAIIQADIDTFCKQEFAEDPRKHLGASIIGHECEAYGWNVFRWLRFEQASGQQLRLFNRGHLEEARFVRWLEGIGFEVREIDPVTQKQFRIIGAKGHFGGSLDSLMKAPERYNIPENALIWLGEFKTHSEKNFAKLAGPKPAWRLLGKPRTGGAGVQRSKPQHFKQMCSYGRAYNIKFGLYCAVNKDTDELYFEIVELDYRLADDLFRKAENIVFSQTRPQKIAQVPSYADCKICDFVNLCHANEVPTKNCRSCLHASPIDDGKWHCARWNGTIPEDFVIKGCDAWQRIA